MFFDQQLHTTRAETTTTVVQEKGFYRLSLLQ
jgi:hypothetical protein